MHLEAKREPRARRGDELLAAPQSQWLREHPGQRDESVFQARDRAEAQRIYSRRNFQGPGFVAPSLLAHPASCESAASTSLDALFSLAKSTCLTIVVMGRHDRHVRRLDRLALVVMWTIGRNRTRESAIERRKHNRHALCGGPTYGNSTSRSVCG